MKNQSSKVELVLIALFSLLIGFGNLNAQDTITVQTITLEGKAIDPSF